MLTFQVLSDLHVDISGVDTIPCSPSANVAIVPGDVGSWAHDGVRSFLDRCSSAWELVIFVPGNHEFYGGDFDAVDAAMREWCTNHRSGRIKYLNCDVFHFRGVVFVGCTLWSKIFGAVDVADSRAITVGGRPWSRGENNTMHSAQAGWLKGQVEDLTAQRRWDQRAARAKRILGAISESLGDSAADMISEAGCPLADAKIIVVTHHLPSYHLINNKFQGSAVNSHFASNCDDLIPMADYWIFGHSHMRCLKWIQGVQCISNPFGYAWEDTGFSDKIFIA